MENQKMLLNANSFFEKETDEFKKEMEINNLLVDIACEFIKYRAENEMTQKDLAQKLNMTQAMVSKLESGDYNPTVKMLFEIAQKLSWNFKIELNSMARKYNYCYEGNQKLTQNKEYCYDMGLAS
ncbi:helix-turn-helix transcriptional regulator [Clostridium sp. Marseille-P2415]|uniref:helix-turn-helix transcriptional regulator n=1 Tax=Clostridium sp. Marseille-P2415 TaxID=1805471 RepID=UPI00098880E0|nr:helix-turn-helix transcriptional regulator [Clostridium sp. Marseille-P2415]